MKLLCFKRIAALFLSVLLSGLGDRVSAYSISPPRNGGGLPLAGTGRKVPEPKSTVATPSNATPTRQRATYTLGIGKNQPVQPFNPTFVSRGRVWDGRTIQAATQYLVEHESSREFPAPTVAATPIVETARGASPKKKTYPTLTPNRVTDDSVLKIIRRPRQTPRAVRQQSMMQFDVNTAWIELLIHEQQQEQLVEILRRSDAPAATAA